MKSDGNSTYWLSPWLHPRYQCLSEVGIGEGLAPRLLQQGQERKTEGHFLKSKIDFTGLGAFRAHLPEDERFETFRFFVVRWDIVKARYIIQHTDKPVNILRVAGAAQVYGLDRPQSKESAATIDEKRAMSTAIDTSVPVILAMLSGASSPILIDGLHRLYKAYREGKEIIPCYALTSEEEQLCRI